MHPADHDIVLAAMETPSDGGILYKSTDGGTSWSEVFASASYVTGIEFSAVDSDLVALSTRQDVLKSQQQGDAGSWERITPPGGVFFRTVRASPHRAQVFVVGTNDQGIYYTADGGRSWQSNLLEDLFEHRRYQGSSDELSPEVATATNPGVRTLRNISAIVFDPVAPDTFYVAGTRYSWASFGVARMTHDGQTWERLSLEGLSHRNVFDLAVDSRGVFLYAGTFNGTYRLRLR
jgi:hypothetical protein